MRTALTALALATSLGLGGWLSAAPAAVEKKAKAPAEKAKPAAEAKKAPAAEPKKAASDKEMKDLPTPEGAAPDGKPEAGQPQVPEDLLGDEHLREEFGVNEFTAPSIKKLFSELLDVGALPFDKLKRTIPQEPSKDRIRVALQLGTLIADGFLVVHSEKISEFEDVGRSVLKHAKVLGAGDRVSKHTKTILENSVGGDWDTLKNELAETQADVEAEMVLLRDFEIAHLISLGGWLRALEIMSTAAADPFSETKAKKLARVDLVEYFLGGLDALPDKVKDKELLKSVRAGVGRVRDTLDVPEGKSFTPADLEKLRTEAAALVVLIADPK